MTEQPALFEGYEPPPARDESLSRDRIRTAAQQALIASGVHPATRRPTAPEKGTCGDCAHLVVKDRYPNRWFKCGRQLHAGMGLDIRVTWPACVEFEPREERP